MKFNTNYALDPFYLEKVDIVHLGRKQEVIDCFKLYICKVEEKNSTLEFICLFVFLKKETQKVKVKNMYQLKRGLNHFNLNNWLTDQPTDRHVYMYYKKKIILI